MKEQNADKVWFSSMYLPRNSLRKQNSNHIVIVIRALTFIAILLIFPVDSVHAAGASLGLSQADLQRLNSQMKLTRAQIPRVNSIARALVSENAVVLKEFGIDGQSCSNLGPFKLAALNSKTQAVYSRARGKMSKILSVDQLRIFSAVYSKRRQETKQRILCRARRAKR